MGIQINTYFKKKDMKTVIPLLIVLGLTLAIEPLQKSENTRALASQAKGGKRRNIIPALVGLGHGIIHCIGAHCSATAAANAAGGYAGYEGARYAHDAYRNRHGGNRGRRLSRKGRNVWPALAGVAHTVGHCIGTFCSGATGGAGSYAGYEGARYAHDAYRNRHGGNSPRGLSQKRRNFLP